MKRILITFITFFFLCCLVACGNETTDDVAIGNNNEVVANNNDDNPATTVEATAEPTTEPSSEVVEATPEPTEAPVAEATPEPTEEPSVVYEGIDMESDLPGAEWIETFVGIINEPKIVVYSDVTGRKQIVEKKQEVAVNPDTDMVAIYLPDGYKIGSKTAGISIKKAIVSDHSESYVLDSEETTNTGVKLAGISFVYEGEEKFVKFTIIPE